MIVDYDLYGRLKNVIVLLSFVIFILLACSEVHAESKTKRIKDVVKELKLEGESSVKSGVWLRTNKSYASESKLEFTPKVIIKELMKRQDNNSSIDAYVKWQLAGYMKSADWKALKAKTQFRIISAAPGYVPFPALPKSMTQVWDKVHKTQASQIDIKRAEEAWEIYDQKYRPSVEFVNYPIIEYRSNVTKNIPRSTVLHSIARLADLKAIIQSGLDARELHGISPNGRDVVWRPNQYFVGVNRAKDWSPATEKLVRSYIREIQGLDPMWVYKPRMVNPQNQIWWAGRQVDEKTKDYIKKFEQSFDDYLKNASE